MKLLKKRKILTIMIALILVLCYNTRLTFATTNQSLEKLDIGNIENVNYHTNLSVDMSRATSIKWGAWSYGESDDIPTGGKSASYIAGIIALKAGFTPAGVVAFSYTYVSGNYKKLRIRNKIQWGTDSKYKYYQQKVTIYGDGKKLKTFSNSGKTPKNGTGAKSIGTFEVIL